MDTRTSSYEGKTGRVILGRVLRHSDLVSGIIEICRKHDVYMAALGIALGSLLQASLSWTRPSTLTKRGSERTELKVIEGPLEFVSAHGFVCLNGAPSSIHVHGTVCDSEGRLWGGHFFEGGNPVHSTMDVLIFELLGVGMQKIHDPELDLTLPVPIQS